MTDVLRVHLAPTADKSHTYMQIMSGDNVAVNIVLVADAIVVDDQREPAMKEGDS